MGKLRIEQALPQLLERIKEGGEESEQAAQAAAARLGAKGTRALQELMPKRRARPAPLHRRRPGRGRHGQRRRPRRSPCCSTRTPASSRRPSAPSAAQIPDAGAAAAAGLADQLLGCSADKKAPLPAPSESAVVRLLAALDDPRARPCLGPHPAPPPGRRSAAGGASGARQVGGVAGQGPAQAAVHLRRRPGLPGAPPPRILQTPAGRGPTPLPDWLSLLHAPDVAGRPLALEKLGDRDTPEVAAALLEQLRHPDRACATPPWPGWRGWTPAATA